MTPAASEKGGASASHIVVENARVFLKSGGWAVMAVKSRSIDVTKAPRRVYEAEIEKLRKGGFDVVESLELDPFEKDHALVVARLKP